MEDRVQAHPERERAGLLVPFAPEMLLSKLSVRFASSYETPVSKIPCVYPVCLSRTSVGVLVRPITGGESVSRLRATPSLPFTDDILAMNPVQDNSSGGECSDIPA
jgi:hypothetical protein